MNKLITALAVLLASTTLSAQPHPPKPPKPPKPPQVHVQVDIDDLDEMVDEQIENALEAIKDNPNIPNHVRDSVEKRMEKVRIKVKKRLGKIDPKDMEQLGEELGKMGEELGEEMEQFGRDMEKWGKQFEKKFDKQKFKFKLDKGKGVDVDVDFDHDMPGMRDIDDDVDYSDVMQDMGTIKLSANQRQALKKLHSDSDAKVEQAKRELDRASDALEKQLENANVNEAEVARAIDAVTKAESDIRKARILAWVKARQLLDNGQRKQVEGAVKGKNK